MKSDFNERDIIEKAKAGDEFAFETLVLSCGGKAYNIAFGYLKNDNDAQDAVQESFIKLYRHLDSFNFNSRFDTWFYRIVVNVCNDILRRRRNDRNFVEFQPQSDEDGYIPEIRDNALGPEERALMREESAILLKCMDKLPSEQRTVIVLRDINGFSYEEISEMLDCSLGTVKSRISRARLKLREIYTAQMEGNGTK